MEAGSAATRITPPLGTLLAGHAGVRREADAVVDHLYAQAIVVESRGTRAALVSCDLLGIDRASTRRVRSAIEEAVGIDAERVLIAATHTHTGPQTIRLFRRPETSYVGWLEDRIVTAVRLADDDREPVTVRVGADTEPSLCHNRRLLTSDGDVRLPTQAFDPEDVVGVEGPTDPRLSVLAFDGPGGEPVALAVNYATHPELTTGSGVSADYPGALRRRLQQVYGDVPVLFLPGAFGDLSPTSYRSADRATRDHYADPEGDRKAMRAGTVLAGVAIGARETARPLAEPPIVAAGTRDVALETRPPPPSALERARSVLAADDRPRRDRVLARCTLEFAEYQRDAPEARIEVQCLRIGDVTIVGLPGEPFAEHGLRIRDALDGPVLIASCANDWKGYFPTREAFDNGGYETTPGWVSRFEPDAGRTLSEVAIEVAAGLGT